MNVCYSITSKRLNGHYFCLVTALVNSHTIPMVSGYLSLRMPATLCVVCNVLSTLPLTLSRLPYNRNAALFESRSICLKLDAINMLLLFGIKENYFFIWNNIKLLFILESVWFT